MKSLSTVTDLKDKTVLVRVDFNVPLDKSFNITDDRRMVESLPTIQYILDKGGAVVLMSHFGRPENGPEDKYSLRHIQNHLATLLNRNVMFVNDCVGESAVSTCSNLHAGDVVLLENTRFYKEETKGNEAFAQKLAALAQVYVNDAFGSAHRAHASTTTVAKFFTEKYAGFLLQAEIENGTKVLNNPAKPYVAIVGGSKVSDKILIIENLLSRIDTLIIVGGMAYTFLKAQGKEIGKSLCEEDKLPVALDLLEKAKKLNVSVLLPVDSIAADRFAADADAVEVSNDAIPADKMCLDIGPKSVVAAREAIMSGKTILWNGPAGVFEFEKFASGTNGLALAVAEATQKGAYSLIGGGDSASAAEKAGVADKISYISTGGGALLELLEGKTLPGIAALD